MRRRSRSQTATMRAVSCFQTPGRSCPREIRPFPMAPTLILLLGAVAPSTDAGTMAGKAAAASEEPPIPCAAVNNSLRRGISFRRRWVMAHPPARSVMPRRAGPLQHPRLGRGGATLLLDGGRQRGPFAGLTGPHEAG